MRRILAELDPLNYISTGTKEEAENFLNANFGSIPGAGNPQDAFERLVGIPHQVDITEDELPKIPGHCSRWPIILPYCPAPSSGLLVKMIPEDYIVGMHKAAEEICIGNKPGSLHSMCAAGTLVDEAGQRYFVCAQTWDNCEVALIPVIPDEVFARRYPPGRLLAQVYHLNVYYKHTSLGAIPKFPFPPQLPLTYHRSFCLPPLIRMPHTGL
jgi:hypothetical protein